MRLLFLSLYYNQGECEIQTYCAKTYMHASNLNQISISEKVKSVVYSLKWYYEIIKTYENKILIGHSSQ
jgi:hypothetical protein